MILRSITKYNDCLQIFLRLVTRFSDRVIRAPPPPRPPPSDGRRRSHVRPGEIPSIRRSGKRDNREAGDVAKAPQ